MTCVLCGEDRKKLKAVIRGKSEDMSLEDAICKIKECKECASFLYTIYREKTGLCEICGELIGTHTKCYQCGILLGEGHESIGIKIPDYWCGSCYPQRKL